MLGIDAFILDHKIGKLKIYLNFENIKGLQKNNKLVSTDKGTPYAGLTVRYKKLGITKRDGNVIFTGVRPINRVTLLSEGHLYASMTAIVNKNQIALNNIYIF